MEDSIYSSLNYPILTLVTLLPLLGSLLILFIRNEFLIKWVALATTMGTFDATIPIYKYGRCNL